MREDMYKVIVERPRRGGSYSRDGRRFRASEDAPTKIGMRKGYGSRKYLNENLAPLRRYLERQAGRPWNLVFSDICAVIDNRDTVRQHVRTHIEDFVAIKTRMEKGRVVTQRWRFDGKFAPLSEVYQQLYVDSLSGLLLRNTLRKTNRQKREDRARQAAAAETRRRILGIGEMLLLVEGIWYALEIEELPQARMEQRQEDGKVISTLVYDWRWDVVRKAWVSRVTADSEERYGRRSGYAVSKRQLGKRELHRFGLKDPGRDSRRRPSITPGKPGSHRKVSGLFCFRSGLFFNNADVAIASPAC